MKSEHIVSKSTSTIILVEQKLFKISASYSLNYEKYSVFLFGLTLLSYVGYLETVVCLAWQTKEQGFYRIPGNF